MQHYSLASITGQLPLFYPTAPPSRCSELVWFQNEGGERRCGSRYIIFDILPSLLANIGSLCLTLRKIGHNLNPKSGIPHPFIPHKASDERRISLFLPRALRYAAS